MWEHKVRLTSQPSRVQRYHLQEFGLIVQRETNIIYHDVVKRYSKQSGLKNPSEWDNQIGTWQFLIVVFNMFSTKETWKKLMNQCLKKI